MVIGEAFVSCWTCSNLPAHRSAKCACSLMVTKSWLDFEPSFLITNWLVVPRVLLFE